MRASCCTDLAVPAELHAFFSCVTCLWSRVHFSLRIAVVSETLTWKNITPKINFLFPLAGITTFVTAQAPNQQPAKNSLVLSFFARPDAERQTKLTLPLYPEIAERQCKHRYSNSVVAARHSSPQTGACFAASTIFMDHAGGTTGKAFTLIDARV